MNDASLLTQAALLQESRVVNNPILRRRNLRDAPAPENKKN